MLATILVYVPLAIFPLLQPSPPPDCQLDVLTPLAIEERSLAEFNSTVTAYARLHRLIARTLPPSEMFDDEDPFFADELRRALIAARPLARRGEFFTPPVADLFRQRLDVALPWALIDALPRIPPELEFVFRGRDLVLIDVAADLVLDVLADALPAAAVSDVIYR